MKKTFSESPVGKFLLGKGFYAALAACVLGAGAAAWVIVDKTIDSFTAAPPADAGDVLQAPSAPEIQSRPELQLQQPDEPEEPVTPVDQTVSGLPVASSSSSSASVSSAASATSSGDSEPSAEQAMSPVSAVSSFLLPVDNAVFNHFSGDELVLDETLEKWHTHDGVDIKAQLGDQVRAAADGTVTLVRDDPMWGTVVEISHAGGLLSRYCGLDEELSVIEGQWIAVGDPIGQVGDTNLAETALETHLHFELWENGERVDPLVRMGFLESDD